MIFKNTIEQKLELHIGGRMYSEWISYQDLLNRWGIKDVEIFKFLKNGLQPYERSGHPIECPKYQHQGNILNSKLSGITTDLYCLDESENAYRISVLLRGHKDRQELRQELEEKKNKTQKELKDIEDNDPSLNSWKYFIKPIVKSEIYMLINMLEGAQFKLLDVIKIERNKTVKQFVDIPQEVYEILIEAENEIEPIFNAVKTVGFSSSIDNSEEKWQQAATQFFTENKDTYIIVKMKHLKKKELYYLSGGQERRDFITKLLKIIMEDNNFGGISGSKLYKVYKSTNRQYKRQT